MIKQAAVGRARFAVLALVALFAGSTFVPAAQAAKPKDGVYYQTFGTSGIGYVSTDGGKITGAAFATKWKNKQGKSCVPKGFQEDSNGYINTYFETKGKVKSSGKFTVKNKKSPVLPGLKATVTGKFKTTKNARFKVVQKVGNCSSTRNFNKAVYTAGG